MKKNTEELKEKAQIFIDMKVNPIKYKIIQFIDERLLFTCILFIVLGGIIPSVVATVLAVKKGGTFELTVVVEIVANVIILGIILYRLFDFRMVHEGKLRYYFYNVTAMFIYCILGVGGALLLRAIDAATGSLPSKIYTFLFFNFKSIHYFTFGSLNIGTTWSAIFYSIFYMLIVCIFPLFIRKKEIIAKNEIPEQTSETIDDTNEKEEA